MRKLLFLFFLASGLPVFAQLKFQTAFGGPVSDFCWGTEITSDGNYILVGNTTGSGPGGMHLIKTNSTGDTLWARTFGGAAGGEYGLSVQETKDAGFIVSGSTHNFNTTGGDGYLVKTDSTGNVLWSKTYGGIRNDEIMTVRELADGGFILYGSTSSFSPSATDFDIFLIRTDANGDTLWAKTYGTAGSDNALGMEQTSDSGFVMTGYSNGFANGQDDAFLMKTDGTGNLQWAKSYGGTDSDAGSSVRQTSDGGYILTGKTHSYGAFTNDGDALLIKTDMYGDTLWSKTFGGPGTEWCHSICLTGDGGFALSGETWSYGAGKNDVFVVKTTGNGILQWSKTYGDTMFDHSRAIRQTSDNGYVLGCNSSSLGGANAGFYMVKTDSAGNSGCNTWYSGPLVRTHAIQTAAQPVSTWQPTFTVTNPATLTGSGTVVTPFCTNVGINEWDPDANNALLIYPNPNTGVFTIEIQLPDYNNIDIQIFNTLGQLIDTFPMSGNKHTIDITNYENGIYSVRLTGENFVATQRVIVNR